MPTRRGDVEEPVTTGWPTAIPSLEPLSIVTVQSKFETPLPITTAGTASGSSVPFNPRRSSSVATRCWSS